MKNTKSKFKELLKRILPKNIQKYIISIRRYILTDMGAMNEYARDAWVAEVLSKIPAHSKILDAGAGQCRYRKACSHLEYTAQDFGKYDGTGDGSGLQTGSWDNSKLDIVSDITSIPVPDSCYDVVLCTEVFEHIPDPISATKEFSRILKPGGTLIITAPFCSMIHFSPYHFYTGFTKFFYEYHLPKYGFVLKEVIPNGNFFNYVAQDLRYVSPIAEKYCGKRTNLIQKISMLIVLRVLKKLNRYDRGSSEVLNFGYHVIATRK
jgi:ubiquinone/menaquinone biosynthesis C-methylase UbiE